jgi:hypothetical protein
MGNLLQEAQEELQRLNEEELREVRQFIRQLQQRKQGVSLQALLPLLGGLSAEEAKAWEERVEQDCRRVDIHEW